MTVSQTIEMRWVFAAVFIEENCFAKNALKVRRFL